MDDVVTFNRNTLASVESFIKDEDYEKSKDLYGLPRFVYHLINKPMNRDLTYVDLLMFLRRFLNKEKVSYLEIGVSVLKTFFQVANYLENSHLYAYDINLMNPTIESKFTKVGLCDYEHKSNKITYFRGDVFKVDDLNKFKYHLRYGHNNLIDILFSDANHSYNGLMSEYNNMIKDILSEEFILYYDDLNWDNNPENEDMDTAFSNISQDIRKNRQDKKITVALLNVNGWLGNHEFKHTNGIITTLDIKTIFQEHNINIDIKYL